MHLCQHFRGNFIIGCPQSTILTAHRLKEKEEKIYEALFRNMKDMKLEHETLMHSLCHSSADLLQ